MKISFLKSKIRSLRRYDLFKAIIDILLPDFQDIGDYNPNLSYRKGDRVYYFNTIDNTSRIIEALVDITPTGQIDLSQWSVVSGNSLPNSNLLKKFQVNENNNLMYEGATLNNVHVSVEEPIMNERDMWFGLTKRVGGDDDNGDTDDGEEETPTTKEGTLVIKNMVVQDEQPSDNTSLWGDIEPD